ncbi:MAG TPA: adenylate/guanylate cyclase domain-containing protein, partial [Aeromicrobium sp.]|nr:adenylate/guanylate cyclase domain-containing protein [Aeromicrobium sp.]
PEAASQQPATIKTPAQPAAATMPLPATAIPAASEKKPAHLLVVDDNEMNRDMLSRRLKSRGFTVKTADDGQQAVDIIAKEEFDLVLLDIMMPVLSGIDALKIVRQTKSVADLPIIMATAKDQGEDIVEALKLGANDYVTKPLDFPVVLARAETQLSLRRANVEIKRLAQDLDVKNRFIRQTFGRYLSDEIVSSLLETPEGLTLGGEKRVVTLLMSDLRGFTAAAERLDPEQVVKVLNNYLGTMADIITEYQGTIDEFIGDAVFALFGAPVRRDDDAERAMACALAMQLAMEEINAYNRREGLPEVEMGIGLNTGEVVVGNIGSMKRAKYGVVGSHVNLTSRIESFTVGGQILISVATLKGGGDIAKVGERLEFQAKGFKDPIAMYDLLGIAGAHNLMLPERREDLADLKQPLASSYVVLDGKHIDGAAVAARIVKASKSGALLLTADAVAALSNVRVRLHDDAGQEMPGDLYGKVLSSRAGDPEGSFRVKFTSVPPEVASLIERVLSA